MSAFEELLSAIHVQSAAVAAAIHDRAARESTRIKRMGKAALAIWMFQQLADLPCFSELPEFVRAKIKGELISVCAERTHSRPLASAGDKRADP